MVVDYHTHTALSGDNNQTIDELCMSALERGINEICITEHVDFEPEDHCHGKFNYDTHLKNKEYAKEKYPNLTVKLGVEIDYQKKYLLEIFDLCLSYNFDYIIGSCHRVDGINLYGNDAYYINKTEKEAYYHYFETVCEMICINMFNTVGHFDWVKRNGKHFYGEFDPNPYKNIICEALKEMIKRDMTMEVNAAGFRQFPRTFYPHIDILKWYKELGGENIVYGSDSHSPVQTGLEIDKVYSIFKDLGFNKMTTYTNKIKSNVTF